MGGMSASSGGEAGRVDLEGGQRAPAAQNARLRRLEDAPRVFPKRSSKKMGGAGADTHGSSREAMLKVVARSLARPPARWLRQLHLNQLI